MDDITLLKQGDQIDVWVDISKAEEKDGHRFIYGVASDESVDLDNQIVSSNGIQKSLDYFMKYGKFDYDHKSKDDPAYLIGEPVEAKIEDKKFHVKGELYKGISVADSTWKLLKAGAKMGFSLTGKILGLKTEMDKSNKEVQRITKSVITGIAVTPHPKNFNTHCKPFTEFAKSLAAIEDANEMTAEEVEAEIKKALSTAVGSGQPLIGQSLEKKVHKTTFGDTPEDKDKKKKKDEEATKMNIAKSLEKLESGIGELQKAIKRYDDEDEKPEIKPIAKEGIDEGETEEQEEKEKEITETEDDASKKKAKKVKKDKKAEKAKEDEDDEEEEGGPDAIPTTLADDDEEEDASKKKMSKAFEVTPLLKHIGEELEDSNILVKSLVDSHVELLKAITSQADMIKSQADIIKSFETRIIELEDQPLQRKSVSRALPKLSAGEGQAMEMAKAAGQNTIAELMEKSIKGEASPMDVVKAELGVNE